MVQRIDPTPLRVFDKQIEARDYNPIRLALRRLGAPLRIVLREHRGLDVFLDNDVWLCRDANNGATPILAWREFRTRDRDGLHQPVWCKLYLYHQFGGMIMRTVLDETIAILQSKLTVFRDTAADS